MPTDQTRRLSLARVYGSPAISGPIPRAVKLSPDGRWITSLRPRDDDAHCFDLWAMDTSNGNWRMIVDSLGIRAGGQLSESEKMQRERARITGMSGVVQYDWSADSGSVLVPLDGDILFVTVDGKTRRLTGTKAGELDATVSPQGAYMSYVRHQNLFILDLATLQERQLSHDGGGTTSWGVAEFVAQEEMGRTRGHWWSPNDRMLAVARVDEARVALVSHVAIGAEGTEVYEQRYPRAGMSNALVDLYIFSANGDGQMKIDLGPNRDTYLARVDWMNDSKSLLVQRQSRDQKTLDLLLVDPMTGVATELFSETAEGWINLHDNLRTLHDGSIVWTSERDGFCHVYRFKNEQWTQLTSGSWTVRSIVGVDEARGVVYFTGNRETPIRQQLYAVHIDGGPTTQITTEPYWHDVTMNRSASHAIVTRSNANTPPQVYLADNSGRRVVWIEENRLDERHPYGSCRAGHVSPRFGTVAAADGTTLHTKLLIPTLAAGQKAPVLIVVYNGPVSHRQVTDQWGEVLHQYLLDRGWIIFSVDGRGSPDRGKAFEEVLYRAAGEAQVADQLTGVEWLKTQPYVDPSRIALYGWSFGGFMTLKLLQAAPGAFAAAVSGAPVTNWALYDTHYTERYLGDPNTDPEVYERASALTQAEKICDPLLLIHGMADDNVLFENSTALMLRLQRAARPFETMVYPGETHAIGGPRISVHLWETILTFLEKHLGRP